jgi:hypothetical protein
VHGIVHEQHMGSILFILLVIVLFFIYLLLFYLFLFDSWLTCAQLRPLTAKHEQHLILIFFYFYIYIILFDLTRGSLVHGYVPEQQHGQPSI